MRTLSVKQEMWFVTPDAHQPAAAREGTCEYMQDHIRAARKASLCKKPPRALHEGIHYRCVILRPPFRMHENYIDCFWKLFEQCCYPAGHLANTRGNRHRIVTLHNCMEALSEEGNASASNVRSSKSFNNTGARNILLLSSPRIGQTPSSFLRFAR